MPHHRQRRSAYRYLRKAVEGNRTRQEDRETCVNDFLRPGTGQAWL